MKAADMVIKRLSEFLTVVSASVANLATLILVLLISLDVFKRAAFRSPFSWTIEIATYLMATIVLCGLTYAESTGANIRVELGLNLFRPPIRLVLERLGRWLAMTLILVAAWQSFEYCFNAYEFGKRSWGVLGTELWIPQLVLGPAFLILAVRLLWSNIGTRESLPKRRSVVIIASLMLMVILVLFTRLQSIEIFGKDYPIPLLVVCLFTMVVACCHSFKDGLCYLSGLALLVIWGSILATQTVLMQGVGLGVLLCVLLFIGLQIGYSLGVCALVGLLFILPSGQLIGMPERIWGASTSYELTAVPAFVLMGILLLRSGITNSMFQRLANWLVKLPNGLAHAGILASGVFATVSGSSMATAATISKVACPEMLSRDYEPRLVYGCLAAGGTLGILIPPSIALIIYGSVVGVSVSALFIAGFIPGIMLLLFFMIVVTIWTFVQKSAKQVGVTSATATKRDRGEDLRVMAFLGLIFLVLGSIYMGLATPTEAGSVGAIGAALLCITTRTLSYQLIRTCLLETVQVTAFLMLIVMFASVLTYVVDFTKIPRLMIDSLSFLVSQPLLLFIGICLVYIVLGMFFEPISMMLVTLPVVFPLMTAAGFDPVWFGIVLVVLMEVGLMTPPIGLNLFVIKGVVPGATLLDISLGALPFLMVMLLLLAILYAFPSVALWLPTALSNG